MSYRYQHGEWMRHETVSSPRWDLPPTHQIAIYTILAMFGGYYVLQRLDYFPLLPLPELLWNILVYSTPSSLVIALDKSKEEEGSKEAELVRFSDSRTFAAKSNAMRRILGIGGNMTFQGFGRPRAFSGVSSLLKSSSPFSLPGLGNWDNSCYQNSIIQGLASLPSMPGFLKRVRGNSPKDGETTAMALGDIIEQLNDRENGGRRLWTPAPLKSMSSWQQQDAQEYYSKIFDDIEKETKSNIAFRRRYGGLKMVKAPSKGEMEGGHVKQSDAEIKEFLESALEADETTSSPLEGLLAQRVGCLQCGYVEGLSLVPFNCITLPLSRTIANSVEDCLDDFTQLERIDGVECGRCTLLQQERNLKELLTRQTGSELEPLFRDARERLSAVSQALKDDDYSDNTISKKCQVTGKQRVSSSKTKQAVIARKPESLVLHVNRSVFDEVTGVLSKNPSRVSFPESIDLDCWSLGASSGAPERWNMEPNSSLLAGGFEVKGSSDCSQPTPYVLRSIITHYGRHENGHYICYRRDPSDAEQWWRLSDDDVSPANLNEVLSQGGVFMLFYARVAPKDEATQEPDPVAEDQHVSHEIQKQLSSSGLTVSPDTLDCHVASDSVIQRPLPLQDEIARPQGTGSTLHADGDSQHLPTSAEDSKMVEDEDLTREMLPAPQNSSIKERRNLPAMRTSGAKSSASRHANRPGMQISNMVAAN